MQALGIGYSDIGKRRANNEDALFIDNQLGLFVVSDGMGGHAGGEVAAQIATETVARYIRSQQYLIERVRQGYVAQRILPSLAGLSVLHASRAVYQEAQRRPELTGMGCTLTVLIMGRGTAAMAHVGDSRLYMQRHGELVQLSTDHTVAEEFVRMGLITQEQVSEIPGGHHLARAVGVRETVQVDERLFPVQQGDRFLLCSDGVWGYLQDTKDMAEFLDHLPGEDAAESLVMFANTAGGRDNATALVVAIGGEVEPMDAVEWRRRVHEIETASTLELPPVRAQQTYYMRAAREEMSA